MHFYTTASVNYLGRARVLAKSIKKYNPGAIFHLVLIGHFPLNFDPSFEPFDHIWYASDIIDKEYHHLFFIYDALELCGGLKPLAALHILNNIPSIKTLTHLDSDIAVYSCLDFLKIELQESSILLTPHLLAPNIDNREIVENELTIMRTGIFNTGFFAIKNDSEGRAFLSWWWSRLKDFGQVDLSRGLFADQKWVDFAPSFFQKINIIRDPGCNVATWNLSERKIQQQQDGTLLINNKSTLKFFHFSGFDSGAHRKALSHYANTNSPEWNLSLTYERELIENEHGKWKSIGYPFGHYKNGKKIYQVERRIYNKLIDLQKQFPDPFSEECYQWMRFHIHDSLRENKYSIRRITIHYLKFSLLSKISFGSTRKKYNLNKEICKTILKKAAHGCLVSW